jgi:SM-20-related protein
MANVHRVMSDSSLFAMSRQALANDGHCAADAPEPVIAAFVFEQIYLGRMTKLVQERGDFWGGKSAVPARACQWARATRLLTAAHVSTLAAEGLLVIDGALSEAEVAAARAEVDQLDAAGMLEVVDFQSKARIRNDRIGWIRQDGGSGGSGGSPTLNMVARLLRALPAEVQKHDARLQLTVPTNVMVACYDGNAEREKYYRRHFDGGSAGNPRRLTCIIYLNPAWDAERDGGCLRAYLPGGGAGGDAHRDIAPVGGRLVLFDSVTVEHEVRPAYARRSAMTLWANDGMHDGMVNKAAMKAAP